jgi:hypothetical protein
MRGLTAIIIIIVFLCIPRQGSAQDQGSFRRYDTETYRYYLEEKWDSLIHTGNQALKAGIDYYYLRMRLGIAWYGKKNYRKAATHFTRALEWNQQDPAALEYLYYSRLYAGQEKQAELVRKQFRGNLALKMPPPEPAFLDRAAAEYSFCRGLNDKILNNPLDYVYFYEAGAQYFTRNFSNASFSVTNALAPGISLKHTYTFLAKENLYFYYDGISGFRMAEQQVRQHQYYLSPRFTTPSGLKLIPVFHLMHLRYQVYMENNTGYQGGSSITLGFMERNDFLAGLAFSKASGTVDLDLEGYYAGLNGAQQVQNRIGLTWYPLGNLNLYAGGFVNSQYESGNGEAVLRIIPELLVGFAIRGKVWISLDAAAGEMTNYVENYGEIIYNSYSETIEKKARISLSVPVSKKGSILYIGGQWAIYRSELSSFLVGHTEPFNALAYQTITIYGGLSWKL